MTEGRRSNELEELRLMLFPHLSREDGWGRIDGAFERAADRERVERVELLANDARLDEELVRRLKRLREPE